jgi:hypothetical protein
MSDTLQHIDEYLARQRKAQLLMEQDNPGLDPSLVNMIVTALPEYCFGDEFRNKLTAMLADKLPDDKIEKIAQALIVELPARAEIILKSLVV